jgi:hypothetical protein
MQIILKMYILIVPVGSNLEFKAFFKDILQVILILLFFALF